MSADEFNRPSSPGRRFQPTGKIRRRWVLAARAGGRASLVGHHDPTGGTADSQSAPDGQAAGNRTRATPSMMT
jgi:hypothetical protein